MIVCNGDSFTDGFYLSNRDHSWPGCLQTITGSPVKNIAMGGSSNQRITRTTKEALVNYDSVDAVIIGWTGNSRNELFSANGDYIRATTGLCLGEKTDNTENRDQLAVLHKNWLVHNFNPWLNYRQWIFDTLFLQDYFKSKKIKYKFFSAFEDNLIQDFLEENDTSLEFANHAWVPWDKEKFAPDRTRHIDWIEMTKLVKKIDLSGWILDNKETMSSYLDKIGITEKDEGGHPLEGGHQAWAKVIMEHLS